MTDGNTIYNRPVHTEDGYTLMYPNIGDKDDFLTSHPIKPYEESAIQLFPLGTKLIQGERVWRYSKNGSGTLVIAGPVQGPAVIHAEQNYNIEVGATSDIGDFTVTLTGTTNLDNSPNDEANAFSEGYLFINDEAGEGQCYKIKSNEAFSTTDDAVFTLYDPLTIALTTSSQAGLLHNPYNRVVAAAAVNSNMVIGVPLLAITASYFFWAQSGGPAPVRTGSNNQVLGTMSIVGTNSAQSDPMAAFTTETIIGYPMTPCDTQTETFMCFLTLDR